MEPPRTPSSTGSPGCTPCSRARRSSSTPTTCRGAGGGRAGRGREPPLRRLGHQPLAARGDDFVVSTVYGDDPGLPTLLGSTYGWDTWNRLLEPRFLRAGAYTVYAGEYDWTDLSGHRVVPEVEHDEHPDAWQGEDEIFVPFHHTDGHILGVFNVAQPRSGRRPSDEELQLLTTVVRHAARAVQRAQEMAAAAAHRRALEHLLQISSKLTETASGTTVLEAVTAGISEALGFERVVVHLRDPETDALVPAAASGFALDDPRLRLPFGFPELQRLFVAAVRARGMLPRPLRATPRRCCRTSRASIGRAATGAGRGRGSGTGSRSRSYDPADRASA